VRPPTAAQAGTGSVMRPPTGAQGLDAPPAGTGMKSPTGMPPSSSQVRPPTAAQPAPSSKVSGVKMPTGVEAAAAAAPAAAGVPAQTVIRLFPAAVAKLVVVRGLKTDVEFPVYEGQNFIGRHDESPVDIDITDQEAEDNPWSSRQHACVHFEGNGLFVEDLKSVNGTFVNKVKLTPGEKTPLKNGDFIQTGTVMFRVKC
jgi:hypothetical protein